jgi:hypothetical protein
VIVTSTVGFSTVRRFAGGDHSERARLRTAGSVNDSGDPDAVQRFWEMFSPKRYYDETNIEPKRT